MNVGRKITLVDKKKETESYLMDRENFIADTASKILASMYSNSEKYPDVQVAVSSAVDLWNELVGKNIKPSMEGMDLQNAAPHRR